MARVREHQYRRCRIAAAAALTLCVALAQGIHARPAETDPAPGKNTPGLRPDPGYSPRQVVRLLVEALADNDRPHKDAGIQTVFRFASPANKRVTGPLAHFTIMLPGRTYGPMLDHVAANYGPFEAGAPDFATLHPGYDPVRPRGARYRGSPA